MPNIQTNNAGTYQATITNPDGTTHSTACVVTILALPPNITQQPASVLTVRGTNVTFSITCLNPVGVSYQWLKNNIAVTGATNRTLTLSSVSDSDVAAYIAQAFNVYGTAASAAATLRLIDIPSITTNVSDVLATKGLAATLSVFAQGSGNVSYQWFFQGASIANATASIYTIASPATNNVGQYYVRVSNEAGAVTSRVATVTLKVPTTILAQPQSIYRKPGDTATFSVSALGRGSLSYQWAWNGTGLPGSIDNTLVLTNVQPGSSGSYLVTVTGLDGATNSQAATLTVDNLPSITGQPQDVALDPTNRNTTLTVTATSGTPLTYQWQLNGTNLTGASLNSLSIVNATSQQEGNYQVVVSNLVGSTNSRVAFVRVAQPPVFTIQPVGAVLSIGDPYTLTSATTGRATIKYQWQKMGANIAGATKSSLTFASIQNSDFATYQVVATNIDGVATSSAATLTHSPTDQAPPAILVQPQGTNVATGAAATFSVATTGSTPMTYQWKLNGTNLAGGTMSSLTISNTTAANCGNYSVGITNSYGGVLSSNAPLAILYPPVILSQPSSLAVVQGATMTITLVTSNAATYFWKLGSSQVAVTGVPQLTVANVQASAAGSYTVVCSNVTGSVTSQPIAVTINIPPSITSQFGGTSVGINGTLNLTVGAAGTAPLSYTWMFGGAPISGATTATLTINNIQPGGEGYYSVKVTNAFGAVTSANVPVVVRNPPVITSQPPTNITLNPGGPLSISVAATGRTPLRFAWYKNLVVIAGATNSTFAVATAQASDSGSYFVQVLNSDGSASSWPVTVSVNVAPYTTSTTSTINPTKGSSITLSSYVYGTAPISYRWMLNGTNLAGGTSSVLTVTNLQTINEGVYSVFASNVAGSATFNISVVTVKAAPVILQTPVGGSVAPGAPYTFSVTADGRAPLAFQWYKGSTAISGAATNTYTIPSAQTNDASYYYVRISNSDGFVNSAQVYLSIIQAARVSLQPRSVAIPIGGTTNIFATYISTAPASCLWYKDGLPIPGATNTTYTISGAQLADQGTYNFTVSNIVGGDISQPAAVTVIYPPNILSNPVSKTLVQGNTLQLEVTASGKEPMTYTWLGSGRTLSGITSRVLTIQNIQPAQAGSYYCIVSNTDGSATSSSATVTVRPLPIITQNPSTVIVTVSNAFTLQVAASGTGLSYQWIKDGTNIVGAVQSTYTDTNASFADAGTYAALVSNSYGSIQSDPAIVLVLPPQPITIPTNSTQPIILQLIPIADGSRGMIYYGAVSHTYEIQASSDMATWTTVQTTTITRNPNQFVDMDAVHRSQRFYRIHQVQ